MLKMGGVRMMALEYKFFTIKMLGLGDGSVRGPKLIHYIHVKARRDSLPVLGDDT